LGKSSAEVAVKDALHGAPYPRIQRRCVPMRRALLLAPKQRVDDEQ
jgi:hypothetical protein